MTNKMNRFCIPVSIAAGFLALSCLSDAKAEPASSDLSAALRVCIDESDDKLRLACYDREVAELSQPAAELSPTVADAPAPGPGEAAASEKKFGIPPKPDKNELMELTATVVKFSKGANIKVTVWLDNDQVWRQKYSAKFRMKVGDQVIIKKGSFGGYTLIRKGRQIAVTRVQ